MRVLQGHEPQDRPDFFAGKPRGFFTPRRRETTAGRRIPRSPRRSRRAKPLCQTTRASPHKSGNGCARRTQLCSETVRHPPRCPPEWRFLRAPGPDLLQLGAACSKDGPPSAGPRLFLRRRSWSRSARLVASMSDSLCEAPVETLLNRRGRFGRDPLDELPKLPVLGGGGFERLSALGGRQIHEID